MNANSVPASTIVAIDWASTRASLASTTPPPPIAVWCSFAATTIGSTRCSRKAVGKVALEDDSARRVEVQR